MANKYFDDEATLLKNIMAVPKNEILLLPNNKNTRLIKRLLKEKKFDKWCIEAENTNFPPDVYIDEYKLMGDFMMVNDSEHYVRDKKGKLKNINRQKEADSMAYKKLTHQIDVNKLDGVTLIIDSDTSNVPPEELHNFKWYLECFKRVVGNHIRKIPTYQKNHSGYQTIFFVIDESPGYCEPHYKANTGKNYFGHRHLPCFDFEFMKIFQNADVDYVVLHMPWKCFQTPFGLNILYRLVIVDLKYLEQIRFVKYDHTNMVNCGWI